MSVIPFGFVGAVIGHSSWADPVSIMSIFGIVALAGVVVNDCLVLVDYVNRHRDDGARLSRRRPNAGARRFRPILLTSLTTFAGLTPMLLETDLQAQFLIPMAVSLGFGILFATAITLILVPCALPHPRGYQTPRRPHFPRAQRHKRRGMKVVCLDLDEEDPLPPELAVGEKTYDCYKLGSDNPEPQP